MILRNVLFAAALVALPGAAHAWEHVEKGVRISDPWTPATLRVQSGNAVYFKVKNETAAALHLTGVKSPVAGSSTLHTTLYGNDGVARMLERLLQWIGPPPNRAEVQKRQTETAEKRRSLVGTGDRSERIRTYNFPQGRLTDHRINLTLYKVDDIVNGDLDEVIGPLANEYRADQLGALGLG